MYRGWRSTKLHLALVSMGLIVVGFMATGAKESLYGEFCMALIAAAGIYSGASTAEKFVKPPPAE